MDALGTALLDALRSIGPPEVYALVLIAALAETTLVADAFVPGEVGLALAGAVVASSPTEVGLIVAAAALGATVGDSLSYVIGRRWAGPLVCRVGFLRRHVAPELSNARRFFSDHGGPAVFLGRFVGFLRALVPAAAGMSEMPWRRFLAWNVAASVAWAGAVVTLGYVFGEVIVDVLRRAGGYLFVGGVVVLAVLAIRRFTRTGDERAGDSFCAEVGEAETTPTNPVAVG